MQGSSERAETSSALAEDWLGQAYELVRSGWCQGCEARNEIGEPVQPDSPFARQWSAQGSIVRVFRRSAQDERLALDAFVRANLALVAAVGGAAEPWNDAPNRRQDEVAEALLRSVSLVEDGPSGNGPASAR